MDLNIIYFYNILNIKKSLLKENENIILYILNN